CLSRPTPRPSIPSSPTRRSSDLAGDEQGLVAGAGVEQRLLRQGAYARRDSFFPANRPRPTSRGRASGSRHRAASLLGEREARGLDRKSTRLNSSHEWISYAVFCL